MRPITPLSSRLSEFVAMSWELLIFGIGFFSFIYLQLFYIFIYGVDSVFHGATARLTIQLIVWFSTTIFFVFFFKRLSLKLLPSNTQLSIWFVTPIILILYLCFFLIFCTMGFIYLFSNINHPVMTALRYFVAFSYITWVVFYCRHFYRIAVQKNFLKSYAIFFDDHISIRSDEHGVDFSYLPHSVFSISSWLGNFYLRSISFFMLIFLPLVLYLSNQVNKDSAEYFMMVTAFILVYPSSFAVLSPTTLNILTKVVLPIYLQIKYKKPVYFVPKHEV
jgi:hypothetical protein